MTPDQAEALAARTLAAIDAMPVVMAPSAVKDADRERVASDLRAIQRAIHALRVGASHPTWWMQDRDDAWARLKLTAALYGVTEAPATTATFWTTAEGGWFG